MSEHIPVPTAHNTPDGKQWVTAEEYLSLRVAYSKARNALQQAAELAFDAGFGSSVEGFNGECANDHLAPKESTVEGDGSEPYERLKKSSVDAILRDHVADGSEMVEQEPVCWAVMSIADPPHRVGLHWSREFAERWARQKRRDYSTPLVVIPLYARSSPDVKEVGK
jgi:hypothetical protein